MALDCDGKIDTQLDARKFTNAELLIKAKLKRLNDNARFDALAALIERLMERGGMR